MANLITSIPAQETAEFNLYVKPLLDDPQIQSLPFDFIVGKYINRELFFTSNVDKISYKKVSCGWTFPTGGTFTKKTLEPIEIAAPVSQCYTVLKNTIFANGMGDGFRRGELTPEIVDYLSTQQTYAFNRDLLSFLFLGDTSISDTYYSNMDGIYTKLLAGAVAGDGTVDAGPLTASNTNPSNFFTTMKGVYDAQSRQLKAQPKENKVWIWTEALYEQYVSYLYVSTQTNAGMIQRESIEAGLNPTEFMGIKIIVVKIVDERLEADFLDGSGNVIDPYRAILTVPSNHKVLMDASGMLAQNLWYEKKDDTYYLTGSAIIAYDYGFGDLNVFAGF